MSEAEEAQKVTRILERLSNRDGGCNHFDIGGLATRTPTADKATLDGTFTAEELEAIVFVMRNKKPMLESNVRWVLEIYSKYG